MSNFSDALNNPLPSKAYETDEMVTAEEYLEAMEMELFGDDDEMLTESEDYDFESYGDDDMMSSIAEEDCYGGSCTEDSVDTDDIEDLEDDGDDFDPDDMSEEELAALDRELRGDAMDSVVGDNSDEISLSPDEEMRADDMMNMAATTMLVNDELNAEEKAEFLENQASVAIEEGFMSDADANEMTEELGLAQEGSYNKKMIIRLDAAAKKKQLYALGINVSAAAHNDPDYVKLRKVMKMRKILRSRLEKKYHAEGMKRMKIYFARLKRSKSGALAKIGSKFSK